MILTFYQQKIKGFSHFINKIVVGINLTSWGLNDDVNLTKFWISGSRMFIIFLSVLTHMNLYFTSFSAHTHESLFYFFQCLHTWIFILLLTHMNLYFTSFSAYTHESLLSHLLIAGCDIGVQISLLPSVRPFVRSSVRQHLRRSLVFSTSEIAASLKPCIVIVPDIPFKHAP